MRALLDVNVLIALLDIDHASHQSAAAWFSAHVRAGWASCPITQNGCVRIMSNRAYRNPLPMDLVARRLGAACEDKQHQFWPDDISFLDRKRFATTHVHNPRQLTDVYLLSLAVHNDGRFVTFDSGIALAAVVGAKPEHLVKL